MMRSTGWKRSAKQKKGETDEENETRGGQKKSEHYQASEHTSRRNAQHPPHPTHIHTG